MTGVVGVEGGVTIADEAEALRRLSERDGEDRKFVVETESTVDTEPRLLTTPGWSLSISDIGIPVRALEKGPRWL
jgi:hypothetical protein